MASPQQNIRTLPTTSPNKQKSQWKISAIDGCSLACTKQKVRNDAFPYQ